MKKVLLYITILAGLGSMTSCLQDTDDKFDDPALVRVNKALLEYNEILQSSPNGWSMEYYPGPNQKWGGFNLLMKFGENEEVSMRSYLGIMPQNMAGDATILEQTKTYSSLYSLKVGDGPMLSFDTHNEIMHYFSEPNTTVGDGQARGFRGDYEFNIYEASADKIVLRGRKTNNWAIMHPIPTDISWDTYIEKSQDLDVTALFNVASVLDNDTEVGTVNLSGERTLIFKDKEGNTLSTSPFTLTDKSIVFYPDAVGKTTSKEFEELEWNGSNFASKDGTIVLAPKSQTPVAQLLSLMPLYIGYDNMSPTLQNAFEVANDYISEAFNPPLKFGYFSLLFYDEAGSYLAFDSPVQQGTNLFSAYFVLNYSLEGNDIIKLNIKSAEDNAPVVYNNGGYIFYNNIFNNKTFSISSENPYRVKKLTLTDKNNPNNWFVLDIEMYNFLTSYYPTIE